MPRKPKQPEQPAEIADVVQDLADNMPAVAEAVGPHNEAVLARRPKFMNAPEGWIPTRSASAKGVMAVKQIEDDFHTVALQFASEPPRAVKDIIEIEGFQYDPRKRKQQLWERTDHDHPGENIISVNRLAERIAPMLHGQERRR